MDVMIIQAVTLGLTLVMLISTIKSLTGSTHGGYRILLYVMLVWGVEVVAFYIYVFLERFFGWGLGIGTQLSASLRLGFLLAMIIALRVGRMHEAGTDTHE